MAELVRRGGVEERILRRVVGGYAVTAVPEVPAQHLLGQSTRGGWGEGGLGELCNVLIL